MATKNAKAPAPVEPDKTKALNVVGAAGKTPDRLTAELAVNGVASLAVTLSNFSEGTFGKVSLSDAFAALKESLAPIKAGDLSGAETMLAAQAAALNAMFGELARRSALNMGEYLDASERYMRLALKAQGQCRATLETLAAIKNPPVVFARQANINNGGLQQVNNGAQPVPAATPAAASGGGPERLEPAALETASVPTRGEFRPIQAKSNATVTRGK